MQGAANPALQSTPSVVSDILQMIVSKIFGL
jgi:hypothetical protein